ncbi:MULTISPECIES: M56 family metallopeptidase [Butyrivibrio]|uniref:M56 family metallopeptidase n=1 Tax=Butyrivibrio TaxID=830 RepID=UPI0004103204|nr:MULTISPECIES: M56 family metallopeptidase [Butyrivibrio]
MTARIVEWAVVFYLFFGIMVVLLETLFFIFRKSISYNRQYCIRRLLPFITTAFMIVVYFLRKLNTGNRIIGETAIKAQKTLNSCLSIEKVSYIVGVYCAFVALFILHYILYYIIISKKITKSKEITQKYAGVIDKQDVTVCSWDKAKTPFCFGIINKKIVLPEGGAYGSSYVIHHELSHCENNDPLWMMISKFFLYILWLNPLAYYYYRQLKYSCEYACDERVTKQMSFEEKKIYANVILNNTPREQGMLFGEALVTEKTLKNRFKNILAKPIANSKKSLFIIVVTVLSVSALVAFAVAKKPAQMIKSVKVNYSSEEEVKDSVDYEEYIDGKWFRGQLQYGFTEEQKYGIKVANYTGVLYESE